MSALVDFRDREPSDLRDLIALARRFVDAHDLRSLGGERDRNLLVIAGDRRFVLKLVDAAEAAEAVPLQIAALDHLARCAPDLPTPAAVADRVGNPLVRLEDRSAWMVDYRPGRLLSEVAPDAILRATLGGITARLVTALSTFNDARADRFVEWDVSRAAAVSRLLGAERDARARGMAETVLDAFAAAGADGWPHLPRQIIHGDLNPFNIIIDDAGGVSGIIDFGDMHRGPRIAELAIAASYHLADGIGACREVVGGFLGVGALTPAEQAALPLFMAARLAMTIGITADSAARRPAEATYLRRNVAAAIAGLDTLLKAGGGRLPSLGTLLP